MAVYTVHEAPPKAADALPDPERFVFVRDGFYFWAFLLTPLWMLRYRMWAVLACYLVAVSILQVILAAAHASAVVQAFAGLLVAVLAGCEAATLRRWTLTRRKFTQVGLVVGDDFEMAEQRFFDSWAQNGPDAPASPPSPETTPSPRPAAAGDVIGLFPEPGASR